MWFQEENSCAVFLVAALLASRWYSHGKQETDEEFDARWVTYFNKQDIDAWELRKGRIVGDPVLDVMPSNKTQTSSWRHYRDGWGLRSH